MPLVTSPSPAMPATPEDLLAQLAEGPDQPYPEALVREMIDRREEMTPALLAVLEDAVERPEFYLQGGNWKRIVFAGYLLAQFRETRAFKPLCATLRFTDRVLEGTWSDVIAGDMGNILASVYDGDDSPLRDLVSDPAVDEFVRGAAVPSAYACLLLAGEIRLEDLEAYVEHLLSEGLEREPSYVWDGWTGLCANLGFARLVPQLQRAIDEYLCDPEGYRYDDLIARASSGEVSVREDTHRLIDDAIAETSGWYLWGGEVAKARAEAGANRSSARNPKASEPRYAEPRSGPKIGRNDPCPCGSGRKFKKCCGTG